MVFKFDHNATHSSLLEIMREKMKLVALYPYFVLYCFDWRAISEAEDINVDYEDYKTKHP